MNDKITLAGAIDGLVHGSLRVVSTIGRGRTVHAALAAARASAVVLDASKNDFVVELHGIRLRAPDAILLIEKADDLWKYTSAFQAFHLAVRSGAKAILAFETRPAAQTPFVRLVAALTDVLVQPPVSAHEHAEVARAEAGAKDPS